MTETVQRRMDGQTVAITGAGAGLGAAMARQYAAEGARVALLGGDADDLSLVAGWLPPGRVLVLAFDPARPGGLRRGLSEVRRVWGRVDMVIDAAAMQGALPHSPRAGRTAETGAATVELRLS